jgi:hypothetical protein
VGVLHASMDAIITKDAIIVRVLFFICDHSVFDLSLGDEVMLGINPVNL